MLEFSSVVLPVLSPNSNYYHGMKQEGQHPLTGQRTANFRLLANQ